jgi:predicted amidohydrolase
MTDTEHFKLAAIQAAPVMFDRDASTEKACRLIREAGAMGATVAGFGESWLGGYPFFAFAEMRPLTWQAMAEYLAHAVEIPSPTTDQLCEAAKNAGIGVVIGVVERDAVTAGTVYCTLLFIDPRGEIIAGPAQGETILIAEGSRQAVLAAKAVSDIGGHYSRPDLLRLIVDRRPQTRMAERGLAPDEETQAG